ncbi:luciferase family protein [Rhodococcus sp. SORGH_AS_0301]|uniref:luciferase domain-containing protein n=1 Tax=Rhodococcus sp. SORGH_AS_0301 TaxID=3041780 RepID=UPI002781882E|nr:luciferase family protein [Rhodococcus sp. SORGH_AS_0301]MDQ1179561.1 hypothetical protein [Rhodococcus sp. SORGH_AS_0301]
MNTVRRTPGLRAILDDYRRWRAIGPGGLPDNPVGWVVMTALRPLCRETIRLRDNDIRAAVGALELPDRGSRPVMAPFPIPHRQVVSDGDPVSVRSLQDHLTILSSTDGCHSARSHLERRGDALHVDHPRSAAARRARGEIAHVHDAQGSMHVVADPRDVAEIVSRGWGERHPLAGRFLVGLPDSYLYLYAPRNEAEQQQLRRIVDRAIVSAGA